MKTWTIRQQDRGPGIQVDPSVYPVGALCEATPVSSLLSKLDEVGFVSMDEDTMRQHVAGAVAEYRRESVA